MLRLTVALIIGMILAQEYGNLIPNIKDKIVDIYSTTVNSDFYKKFKSDLFSVQNQSINNEFENEFENEFYKKFQRR